MAVGATMASAGPVAVQRNGLIATANRRNMIALSRVRSILICVRVLYVYLYM